ncbi:MAG: SDR family oxidoreductase [Actinobacteria bacterium]|nr:SDR family oxidoreductase [Actinomycetota bacterium]
MSSSSGPLDGQAALVCGATGFVGAEIVRGLAERGAAVAVHTHSRPERAEELVAGLPARTRGTVVVGDLGDRDDVDRIFTAAARELGAAPTIVVNCAYPNPVARRVEDLGADDLSPHFDGFRMHVEVCRRAIPWMREAGTGRIVVISGAMAQRPFPGFALFSATKAALNAFTRALALEVGDAGITVNSVAPGRVESADGDAAPATDEGFDELERVTRLRMALPSPPTPQDLASLVGFLASPDAAAVTGQVIFVAAGEPV